MLVRAISALSAADIPSFSMTSGTGHVVAPGGVFVVASSGFEAAVEDADETVGELAECGLVADGRHWGRRPWRALGFKRLFLSP